MKKWVILSLLLASVSGLNSQESEIPTLFEALELLIEKASQKNEEGQPLDENPLLSEVEELSLDDQEMLDSL